MYLGWYLVSRHWFVFFIHLLKRIMDIAYCITMVFISLKVYLKALGRILNIFFRIFMEDMCVVALAPTIMIIKGSTFDPLFIRLLING